MSENLKKEGKVFRDLLRDLHDVGRLIFMPNLFTTYNIFNGR
jgi:hypothetical protein